MKAWNSTVRARHRTSQRYFPVWVVKAAGRMNLSIPQIHQVSCHGPPHTQRPVHNGSTWNTSPDLGYGTSDAAMIDSSALTEHNKNIPGTYVPLRQNSTGRTTMQMHLDDGEASPEVTVTPFNGVYWGPLAPLTVNGAHEMLLLAIKGRKDVKLFTATAFNRASDTPCASFDVAIDARSGDGCGIFRTIIVEAGRHEPHDIATPAFWYQCEKPEEVVAKVHKHLADLKFFDNFYSYVAAAIDLIEEEHNQRIH